MPIEDIQLSELPSVYLLNKDNLPNCAAIYFVSDITGQILYIGRTGNLVARWRDHHRFSQLKRLNRKNQVSISWLRCNHDINTLSNLETEYIELYKPPLNWTQVFAPIKRITPVETALQQSLQQLAKFNTMIFGFDPIADEKPPTIYLFYPVYGRRGVSGSIRSVLKNINKKSSSLKWKEYHTEPKSFGKFGYWETNYNGIKIDLTPAQELVNMMSDSTRRTVAGVELMAFSSQQLEILIENSSDLKEELSSLEALEEDPIPLKLDSKLQPCQGNNKNVVEVEPWEELKPMPEGEARVMSRQFLHVNDVEVEVCTNENGKYFVRHNVYWWIVHRQKNPDPKYNCIIDNLKAAIDRLPTIRWSGYKFRFETIVFKEDDVEVESVLLLPIAMFEDLVRDIILRYTDTKLKEEVQSGKYQPSSNGEASLKLCSWLHHNSLFSLLKHKSE